MFLLVVTVLLVNDLNHISDEPVAVPIDTTSSGRGGFVAVRSVVRVMCHNTNSGGTGFLHVSGQVVTAQHVVEGCSDPAVLGVSGAATKVTKIVMDKELDLALLTLAMPIKEPILPLSKDSNFAIGLQVSTWGFPGGYNSLTPLLSVGYLAGVNELQTASGKTVRRLIVNAAFNRGNSGGPLLNIETGEVIGVVSSKLTPIPLTVEAALEALRNQTSGFRYTVTRPDGTQQKLSEGQIVAQVLQHLRSQVQLVVGTAVTIEDLRSFIKGQGIKP